MKKILIATLAIPLLFFAKGEAMGYLGVGVTELSEAMKTAVDIEHGILVDKVYEESPAEKADIKIGDIIMEIDGAKIHDYKDLKNAIKSKPNEKVKLHIYRSKKMITKNVELGEKEMTKMKMRMPDIEMDMPDVEEMKKMITIDKEKLTKEMEKLKEELEKLKLDLEELKAKFKE